MPRLALIALSIFAVVSVQAGKQRTKKTAARTVHAVKSGPPEKSVDVVFVGEGYRRQDLGKFRRDLKRYSTRFLKEPPFSWYRKKFNVRGLFVASKDRGCDLSPSVNKVRTLLESHFDSPDGRLLVFRDHAKLDKLLRAAGPVDVAFVMVNTEKYGGAGGVLTRYKVQGRPLPAPVFAAQDTRSFLIAIHELGHSMADLADEYDDDSTAPEWPMPKDEDLSEANVTLPQYVDAKSFETLAKTVKWKHFLTLPGAKRHKWVHEGGYYRAKGVLRPWRKCMMRDHEDEFCPICMKEMAKAIVRTSGDKWDDAGYHKKHPLKNWK